MSDHKSKKHELRNGTLSSTERGIIARCTCGWDSGLRISSLAASVAFRDHVECMEAGDRKA